ncbi:hypothetical protein NUV26_29190 [Burkholderia pseudomultivorans]|uniref:Uncharacterized protein n=2 Tax=Burkholderia cepacia complex TaxID=87882 RepID=A0AAN0RNF5_9BURK|nr:hypothetical protein [Burkholderia pseudomultivorans]AIO30879.1 hypothetical protein DM39_7056 [Burkholderia cenocepacia]KWF65570.1 hypothetical protein WT57_18775 [Burkholderia pseudomultivorans]MDS0796252.1 hypothetical protein [Burkholderia pseudomultivorans]
MNAVSNGQGTKERNANEQEPAKGRGGGQRTVAPTRTRVRASASRAARRQPEPGSAGPVTTPRGDETGEPHWEDDSGETPPEEWS